MRRIVYLEVLPAPAASDVLRVRVDLARVEDDGEAAASHVHGARGVEAVLLLLPVAKE